MTFLKINFSLNTTPKSHPTSFLNVWSQFVSGIMTSLRRVDISIMDNLNYDGSNDRSSNFFFFFFAPGFVKVVLLRFWRPGDTNVLMY